MLERVNQVILQHRILIVLLSFIAVVAASMGLDRIKFSSDYRIYFSPDNPEMLAFERIQDTFTQSDNVLFVVAPKDGKVFTPQTLDLIEDLTEEAWKIPYSLRVDSVTNYQHTVADADDLVVQNLVTDALQLPQGTLDGYEQVALNEPILVKRLISEKGDVTGVNVVIQLPGKDPNTETQEVTDYAYALRQKVQDEHPDIDIYLTGQVVVDDAFKVAAMSDLSHVVPIAFLIAIACIAAYMFRASGSAVTMFSGTLALVIVIFASILLAQGISAWLGIPMSTPSANAPTMILTLAIADAIHIYSAVFQNIREGKTKREAIMESLRINYNPVFLTSFTTAIGFLSMNTSDSPPFQDLGNIVAIGVVAAWLFSVTLLPALLMLLPIRVKSHDREQLGWPAKVSTLVITRYRMLLPASIVIMGLCVAFLPRNDLNDVWSEYFHESMTQRQAIDFTRENLTGLGEINFVLSAKREGGVSDPDFLAALEKAANWLGQQPEVVHVGTFTDIMKRLNKNLHGDDPAFYRIPDDAELAAQYLLLYEMSLPFGLDLNNQIDLSKSSSRLTATLHNIPTRELLALNDRANAWFKENIQGFEMSVGASSDIMFAHIGQRNIRSMLQSSFVALVLISIALGFSMRSAWYGAVSMLPNLLPPLVAFGIWGLFVGQIGLGLSVVFGMTLGITVDYTIHFLSKFKLAREEYGMTTDDAIRYVFGTVGVAIVVTTAILVSNFGALAFSKFALNSQMGLMTAVTIVIALLINFLFLPPLLMALKRRDNDSTASQPEQEDEKDTILVSATGTRRAATLASKPLTTTTSQPQKEGLTT